MDYQRGGLGMSANQQLIVAGTGFTLGSQEVLLSATGNWVCPANVLSVSAVLVGRGGTTSVTANVPGAGGGALAYVNSFAVTPGSSYAYTIDATSTTIFGAVAGAGATTTTAGAPSGTRTAGFSGGTGGALIGGGSGGSSGGGVGGGGGGAAGEVPVIVPAIPEPATWLMMIVGFFFIAATARSKRRRGISTAESVRNGIG